MIDEGHRRGQARLSTRANAAERTLWSCGSHLGCAAREMLHELPIPYICGAEIICGAQRTALGYSAMNWLVWVDPPLVVAVGASQSVVVDGRCDV
jgi:hypothetical protein